MSEEAGLNRICSGVAAAGGGPGEGAVKGSSGLLGGWSLVLRGVLRDIRMSCCFGVSASREAMISQSNSGVRLVLAVGGRRSAGLAILTDRAGLFGPPAGGGMG